MKKDNENESKEGTHECLHLIMEENDRIKKVLFLAVMELERISNLYPQIANHPKFQDAFFEAQNALKLNQHMV